MKKVQLFLIAFLIMELVNAQLPAFKWARAMGGATRDEGKSIFTDASGNVYTAGRFTGTADFNPGVGVFNLASAGGFDIFISKLDASGNFLWAKNMGGTLDDGAVSLAVDTSGNVYCTGYFIETADFDPGSGIYNLTATGVPPYSDFFILKLDASGSFVWAKNIGGTNDDESFSLALDISGNVYTTGYFYGVVDFDPNIGVFNINSGNGPCTFVLKINSNGNFIWAKAMGANSGVYESKGYSVTTDVSGNVYTTGGFYKTVDFDPGTGVFNLTADWYDIFVSKIDANGTFVWAKKMGGSDIEFGYSIDIDKWGNVYTTGIFQGTANFDPGIGTYNLTSSGNQDIFISKLNSSGQFMWARRIGSSYSDNSSSIRIDNSGNNYITGSFYGTVDFDPGAGIFNINAFTRDVFILKLDSAGLFLGVKNIGGFNVSGATGTGLALDTIGHVYTTGYFDGTPDFDPGVGIDTISTIGSTDIFVHKMKICLPTSYTFSTIACDTFKFNGKTYTSSGSYTQIIGNSMGCDSIISLTLTIKHSSASSLSQIACVRYNINNQSYFTSGLYTIKLANKAGCDSIISLNLTIKTVNDTVSKSGTELTANALGATYQWVKCPAYTILQGATSQKYTALINGDYAVIVTQNGCTDTSNCITVSGVGLNNNSYRRDDFQVTPNPNMGQFNIFISEPRNIASIEISNILGVIIYMQKGVTEQNNVNLKNQANGLYFLTLTDNENNKFTKRILIQNK